jgi:hypothetical protein
MNLIGAEAEHLAYRFCVEDRRKFTEPDLLEIEAANLIEQGASLPSRLDGRVSLAAAVAIAAYSSLK